MRRLFIVISLLTFNLVWIVPASAHNQPGPPYLMVNGRYAETNPISGAAPDLPLDLPPESYVAGQPIEFAVDAARVGVPYEYRWRWDQTQTSFEEGAKLTHAFTRSGSYLVQLQAKSDQTGNQYIDYDTVQINVKPRADYQLPKAKISVNWQAKGGETAVTFAARPSLDNSTKAGSFQWFFGDGARAGGEKVTHSFAAAAGRSFPVLKLTDGQGLLFFTTFELNLANHQATAASLPFLPDVVTNAQLQRKKHWGYLAAGALAATGLAIFIWPLVAPKRRAGTKPTPR